MTDAGALPAIDARAARGIAGGDLVTPSVDRRHRDEASCAGAAPTHGRRSSHRLGEVMNGEPQVTPEVDGLRSEDRSDARPAPAGTLDCSMWHGVLLFSPRGRSTGAISQQRRFRRAPSPSGSSVRRAYRLSNVGPGRAHRPAARVNPPRTRITPAPSGRGRSELWPTSKSSPTTSDAARTSPGTSTTPRERWTHTSRRALHG